MRLLFLALSTRGFGETILGVRLAAQLRDEGHTATFLVHEAAAPVVSDAAFRHTAIPDHALRLLPLFLRAAIAADRPDAIVLSDYFTSTLAFEKCGMTVGGLRALGLPIAAIDTWDLDRSGTDVDLYGKVIRRFPDERDAIAARVLPAPIAAPDPARPVYSSLPVLPRVTPKIRRHVRRDLGVSETDTLVLLCTASWQSGRFANADAARVGRLLPGLLAEYVETLGPRATLVHIGPARFKFRTAGYTWLPPMRPERFAPLIAAADLLLAPNVSASTIAAALVLNVPVLLLPNSLRAASLDDAPRSSIEGVTAEIRRRLRAIFPVFPFSMWPLGYDQFLRPVLTDNPYGRAVATAEVFDAARVCETMRALVFDPATREERLAAQAAYVRLVSSLPSGASLLTAGLSSGQPSTAAAPADAYA